MKLVFSGNHKSISAFEWENVAPLSIVTGLNGAGKSQLIQVIAQEYNDALNKSRSGQLEHQSFSEHSFRFSRFNQGVSTLGSISLNSQKVNYSDFRLIVDVVYNFKNPKNDNINYGSSFTYEQEAQLKALQEAKNSTNQFYQLAKSKAPAIWQFLLSTLDKSEKQITPFDILLNFPDHILFEGYYMSSGATLGFAFFLFEYKRLARQKLGLPVIATVAPWQILNEAIEASKLPYRVSSPNSEDILLIFQDPLNNLLDIPFAITITHVSKGYEPEFYELSSGEQTLMSLAMLLYYAKENKFDQDILLLDEPDAHLHPSMTRQFFQVVYDVLVKRYGVTVIMTTHSPSTVALAPEENDCVVYELKKYPTIIIPVLSREKIIESLTEGLLLVRQAMRTVLIEGKDDKPFYEAIYRILSNAKSLNEHVSINFVAGTGVNSVNHWSRGLREAGLSETIRGIIDRDNGNAVSEGINRLDRYSIENYMLDPILILATGRTIPQGIVRHGIEPGEEENIRFLNQEQLQSAADSILNHVKGKLQNITADEEITAPIRFANGKVINYPRWFLERKGKDLFGVFNNEFGRNLTREALTTSLRRIQLIPEDILVLFKNLQS